MGLPLDGLPPVSLPLLKDSDHSIAAAGSQK